MVVEGHRRHGVPPRGCGDGGGDVRHGLRGEHIKVLRRIMRDEADLAPAKVIFTFDGDAAGQKAAMRAFADDAKWTSQSFVAVEKSEGPRASCARRVETRRSRP